MSHRSLSHLAPVAILAVVFTVAGCPGDNPNAPPPPPPTPTAPAAPTGLTATPMSSSQVRLDWSDASTNEDAFVVERCSGPGCSTFGPLVTAVANSTGLTDNSGAAQTSYSYRVRASNNVGASSFSNIATAVTMSASAIPAPPTSLGATAVSSSRIDVTWTDASTNEDGFKIERCQGAGCTNFSPYVTMAFPNGTSHSSALLAASTTYRFRIQSYNGSGGSVFAGPVEATTAAAVIPNGAPSALVATAVSSSRIDLTWTDNSSNEDAFRLERCEGAGCNNFASIGYTPGTSWSDLSRAAQTSYSYRVRASNGAGTSAYSNVASATTATVTTIPAPPSGLTATPISGARISLTWTDNATNEDGFQVERCEGAGCANFSHYSNLPANGTNLQTAPLTPATSYSFRVRSFNGAGSSAYSASASATTGPVLAAPSGLTATVVSSSRIDLSWTDNSSNEDGFVLQRCTGAGCTNFASLVSLGVNATTHSNTGLTASTSYSYRIAALNSTGTSSFSGTATGVTPANLVAPTLNAPTVSGSSVTVTWSYTWTGLASSNDGYQLEESTTSTTSGFTAVHSPLTHTTPYSHTLTNRAAGTFYYRVRAVTAQGNTPYSTVRTVTIAGETEITVYATEDNKLIYSSADPAVGNTVYRTGLLEVGCNFSVLPYGTEYVCGEALMRFNAQAAISGRTIVSAELRLYVDYLGADVGTQFRVAAVARTWNTTNVTMNSFHNGSEVYNSGQVSRTPPTTGAVPYTFDVTAIVQNWANGSFTDNGLFLWDTVSNLPPVSLIRGVGFESVDVNSGATRRPQLVIRYR